MHRLLLLLLFAAPAVAQPSGLYLTGALSRTQFDGERLGQLDETFAAYYGDRLVEPVVLLPGEATHPAFGAIGRANLGGVALSLGYQVARAAAEARADFANGAASRVTSRTLDHVVTIEATTDALGPVILGVSFGGMFRGVRLASSTIYQDGSESFGSEYRLNGVYTASSTYFEGGLVAGLALGDRLVVPVRLLLPFELAPDRLPVTDFDLYELNSTFPRDWNRWLTDDAGLDDGASVSDRDYVGPRVQVGVEVRIL
jgi:hypothetical protein